MHLPNQKDVSKVQTHWNIHCKNKGASYNKCSMIDTGTLQHSFRTNQSKVIGLHAAIPLSVVLLRQTR